MNNKESLVLVASFHWINDAELARMMLESHEIKCEIGYNVIINVVPIYSNATGGIKLKVRQQDYNKAIEILRENESETVNNYKPWCPNCDSVNVKKIKFNIFHYFLSLIYTFAIGAKLLAKTNKCKDCGYKWS